MEIFLVAFILSAIIGFVGMKRSLGFWGYFLCSVIFTPPIGLVVLLITTPPEKVVVPHIVNDHKKSEDN